MSRRSRNRKPAEGGGAWLGKAAVAAAVCLILGVAVGYTMLRRYLHSDSFRHFLSVEASEMAGVSGEFAAFRWDGLAVETASFEAKGDGLVKTVKADGLHTEVGLGGVTRGVWEIRGSSLQRLEISVDARKAAVVDESPGGVKEEKAIAKSKRPAWLPSEAELQGLDVREVAVRAALDQGLASAVGMKVHVEAAGAKDAYRVMVKGGDVKLPFAILPAVRLEKLQLRYQDKEVFLTSGDLLAWKNGRIEAAGDWDMRSGRYSLEGSASGMTCDDIFREDWAKRLTGDVRSTFLMDNSMGGPVARGKLTIDGGVMTALPMLDALAAYADTRRFRVLTLNEARTEWRWRPGELALTNLVIASEGLVRLEGNVVIRGRDVDGVFKLGLAPGTLASIPGAETDVFFAGDHGLLWTPLRLTGTLDDPKEDLTDRLIAAAGGRMFDQIPETGENVIKFARSVMGDNPGKTVEKGVKLIEKSAGIAREVGGVMEGLLGTTAPPVEIREDKK